MDLFDYQSEKRLKSEAPLAARMRPRTLSEFHGQEHIIGEGKMLRRAIASDKITSAIFFGPPGTGKTTLAQIIANATDSAFTRINATLAGIKDIKEACEKARYELGASGRRTIVFIDEIHRFNKSQQDTLLPHVEDGVIILIGATTENPFFEVNKALISRSQVYELFPLTPEDIRGVLLAAQSDTARGMGQYNPVMSEEALTFLSEAANGDARTALNAFELAVLTTQKNESGETVIDLVTTEDCIQKKALTYDKNGENHYDTISAFIKSMRGSNPDAALYYLARMLYSGEDIMFVARRIVICAAEDVGMAEPNALNVAVSAMQAVHMVGMPEARIILAEAAVCVATAPKSNSAYMGIDAALADVKNVPIKGIPMHLRNAPHAQMKDFGRSVGYKYAHDYKNHYVEMNFLPDELKDRKYYNSSGLGYEKKIDELFERLKNEHD